MPFYSTQMEITRFWPLIIACIGFLLIYLRNYNKRYSRVCRLPFITKLQYYSLGSSLHLRIVYTLLYGIMVLAFLLFIISSMQPKILYSRKVKDGSSTHILFLLDVSPSMSIRDIDNTSRWDVVKERLELFLEEDTRPHISIVIFSDYVSAIVPFTRDYNFIKDVLHRIKLGQMGEGTAVSDATIFAHSLLSAVESDRKHLILISDGLQNSGANTMKSAQDIIANNTLAFSVAHIGTGKESDFLYTSPNDSITRIGKVEPTTINILKPFAENLQAHYSKIESRFDMRSFFTDMYYRVIDTNPYATIKNYRDISSFFFLLAVALLAMTVIIKFTLLNSL